MSRIASLLLHIGLPVGLCLLTACATPRDLRVVERPTGGMQIELPASSHLTREEVCHALRYHILDFDEHGQLDFPKSNFDCFSDASDYRHQCQSREAAVPEQISADQRLKCHLQAIRDSIDAGRPDGSRYDHIVLVVHGGLVSEDAGLSEAITATRAMSRDCDPEGPEHCGHYYPIFIVWRSGALPTYGEQATQIEQGKRSPGFAQAMAPLTIATDLARGVVREPRFGASEGLRLWNSTLEHKLTLGDGHFRCEDVKTHMLASRGLAPTQNSGALQIICPKVGETQDSLLTQGLKTSAYVASTPLRMLTTPILLGPGQGAWENMQRRARDLVWRDSNHLDSELPDVAPPAVVEGGLQVLFRDLLTPLTEHRERTLTLIGHSMGAIVVTELLKLYPDLVFDNMVLMGAAVDMRSFIYALRAAREVRNGNARVYNLSLHPDNEVFELSGYGTMPSGSLLQWIDEAYQPPPTQLDRVLGKWTNLPALERAIPPEVAPHISFKMFGFDDGEPQTHGSFNDLEMCYWRRSFWGKGGWSKHDESCRSLLGEN